VQISLLPNTTKYSEDWFSREKFKEEKESHVAKAWKTQQSEYNRNKQLGTAFGKIN
jgi:hypothetical protein